MSLIAIVFGALLIGVFVAGASLIADEIFKSFGVDAGLSSPVFTGVGLVVCFLAGIAVALLL